MKYLICSDTHGDFDSVDRLLNIFVEQHYDYLIHLGDVLYHGPRNDLPSSYNPKSVIERLKPFADKIIAVRGNCDAEVDLMVLPFKFKAKRHLVLNSCKCYFVHGHHLDINEHRFPPQSFVFYGHTHVHKIERIDNVYFINPGSAAIPKQNQKPTYICFDETCVSIIAFDGEVVDSLKIIK